MVQPCIWFKEEPSQFSMGQTAQILTCFIMEKPLAGSDEFLRILLACFRARNSGGWRPLWPSVGGLPDLKCIGIPHSALGSLEVQSNKNVSHS